MSTISLECLLCARPVQGAKDRMDRVTGNQMGKLRIGW